MSEPTNQELKDLILGLDKKIDLQFIELKSDIRSFGDRLSGEIRSVGDRLSGDIKRLEERVGGIDKRLGNEEFISRGAVTAVFVSVAAGVIKYLFSSPTPL
jgi:hypothetical protein